LRADGGLRTGRDVVKAILLGADEFSFGTAAVVAEGCKMARACHLNTCPVGIATQKPELRAKFDGQPEYVMAFMVYVAQEVREILAHLGLKTIDAAIGRVDLLHPNDQALPRDTQLDLKRLLMAPPYDQPRRFMGERNNVSSDSPLNDRLLTEAWIKPDRSRALNYEINNRDRTFGAKLAQAITKRCGEAGVADHPIEVSLRGSAGQSFGAFAVPGMHLTLTGEANDYVGKGMAGGRIVISDRGSGIRDQVLAGNTLLYGATGGELYVAGRVGERFGVRNSGAKAIVEGLGDHGCEYMTGGLAIILGSVGYNFAAGMTGGLAFVYDADGCSAAHINRQMVTIEALKTEDEIAVQAWLYQHVQLTDSEAAQAILADWPTASQHFLKITPKDLPNQVMPLPTMMMDTLQA
ncbi:MAG: glutamate synthase subunit alpha, partial [Chloroflexi bacterium]|nr:glutamate synthase subunit alpha [Chloroflexota bacterium]